MGSYSTDDHMNSKNIHIYKNLFLKGFKKKKKKTPYEGGGEKHPQAHWGF